MNQIMSEQRLAELDVYADDHEAIGELLAEVRRARESAEEALEASRSALEAQASARITEHGEWDCERKNAHRLVVLMLMRLGGSVTFEGFELAQTPRGTFSMSGSSLHNSITLVFHPHEAVKEDAA